MNIVCKICGQVIRAYNMIQHVKHSHPYAFGAAGHSAQTLSKPKNKKIRVPVATLKPDSNAGKRKSVVYEVFQNGELVIVDGIHYFVKRKVAFIDCPMCVSKSMALTMIQEHIKEEHNLEVCVSIIHILTKAVRNKCFHSWQNLAHIYLWEWESGILI